MVRDSIVADIAVFTNKYYCRYQTAYTAYAVQNVDGCNNPTSDPFVIQSPNTNQDNAAQFYCVDGPCRSNGEGYWDRTGPVGRIYISRASP